MFLAAVCNFTQPSYVLYDKSILATRYMTYKGLGCWLFGESYETDKRFLSAILVTITQPGRASYNYFF